ncbi:MAG: FtsB family cell division protein [Gemmatimonadota bacterium]
MSPPTVNARTKKLILYALIAFGVWFAIQGGEYSTTALFRQRDRERQLRDAVDSLTRDVDSLRVLRKAIQSDLATQERIAREEHGLVRGHREILYRFIDSARKAGSR